MAHVTLRIRARCPNRTVVTVSFLPSGQEHYQIEKPPDKTAWEFAGRTFRSLAECTRVVHRRSTPILRQEDLLEMWETADDDPPQILSKIRSKFSPKFTRLAPQIRGNMLSQIDKHLSEDDDEETKIPTVPRKVFDQRKRKTKKRTASTLSQKPRGAIRAPRQVRPNPIIETEPPEVVDPDCSSSIPDLTNLPAKEWTEKNLHLFFNRPERSAQTDPVLSGFGPRAKRYGVGACFKFKADFIHPNSQQIIRQWVRYTDLVPNAAYMTKLAAIHVDMARAKHQFLETNDHNEWSDGVEEFTDDNGKILPDLSFNCTTSDTTKEPSSAKNKKRKPKYPEFSIARFSQSIEGDAEDSEPEVIG